MPFEGQVAKAFAEFCVKEQPRGGWTFQDIFFAGAKAVFEMLAPLANPRLPHDSLADEKMLDALRREITEAGL